MTNKVLITVVALLVLQNANVLLRQDAFSVKCTDKQGHKILFTLGRDFLSLDGSCHADDGKTGAVCRREWEVVGAEGGLCERVVVPASP